MAATKRSTSRRQTKKNRQKQEKPRSAILIWIALALALLIGYFDLHTDDTGIEAAFILICAAGLSIAGPSRAWTWALIIGLAPFAANVIAPAYGLRPAFAFKPSILAALLALLPAGLGAGTGVLLRHTLLRKTLS